MVSEKFVSFWGLPTLVTFENRIYYINVSLLLLEGKFGAMVLVLLLISFLAFFYEQNWYISLMLPSLIACYWIFWIVLAMYLTCKKLDEAIVSRDICHRSVAILQNAFCHSRLPYMLAKSDSLPELNIIFSFTLQVPTYFFNTQDRLTTTSF